MTLIQQAPHPFGRHSTSDHDGCRGHSYNPEFITEWAGEGKNRTVAARGRRLICPHPSHVGQPLPCLLCGEVFVELTDEGYCVDFESCHERQAMFLACHDRYQALLACGDAGAQARREADERRARSREDNGDGTDATPTRRPRGPARPTSGSCEHCGEPTKGGRFVAGHDAKLKGDLKRAAEAGELDSLVELLVRDWPTHTAKVDEDFRRAAELRLVDANQTWLNERIAERLAR